MNQCKFLVSFKKTRKQRQSLALLLLIWWICRSVGWAQVPALMVTACVNVRVSLHGGHVSVQMVTVGVAFSKEFTVELASKVFFLPPKMLSLQEGKAKTQQLLRFWLDEVKREPRLSALTSTASLAPLLWILLGAPAGSFPHSFSRLKVYLYFRSCTSNTDNVPDESWIM